MNNCINCGRRYLTLLAEADSFCSLTCKEIHKERTTPRRYWKVSPFEDAPEVNCFVVDRKGLIENIEYLEAQSEEETETLILTLISLTPEEFDALPEFEGF